MKQLFLALVSLIFASSAYSAPILTFGFFQSGYEEGAFVAGYFRVEEQDRFRGEASYFAQGQYPSGDVVCGGPSCGNVVDYFMFFSGNSRVSAFVHSGLRPLAVIPEGDKDDLVGISMEFAWSTLPFGEYEPPGCNEFVEGRFCTSAPEGFIGSQDWSIRPDGTIDRGRKWKVNDPVFYPFWCGPADDCGSISGPGPGPTGFGLTGTDERVRIFRIPEPPTIALFVFALAGLALTRRRKQ